MTNTNKHDVDDEELKSCLYCGGEARLTGSDRGFEGFGGYGVECLKCPASVGVDNMGDGEAGRTVENNYYGSAELAIKAWNTRTDTQELEQLRRE